MPNPFTVLGAKIFSGVALALLILSAGLWLRGNHYQSDRDNWRSAHKAQAAATIAAQEAARAKAEARRIETENHYAELAKAADTEKSAQLSGLRAAADSFAAARRMRPEAPGCLSGRAGAAAPDGAAPDRDRPGADAVERIVLTAEEFGQLRDNTFRLERVRQWGETLIDQGLAVTLNEGQQ